MTGIADLPNPKWEPGTGRQVILKSDHKNVEYGVLEVPGLIQVPNITWIDITAIKVPATADSPAAVLMSGFPNILHPGAFISGGLTDGKYRVNVADVSMDFDVGASLWGTEKVSQWYLLYALAGNADAVFTVKAMPFLRVKSQTGQVIKTGTLVTPASGINYGFAANEMAGGKIYFLTGASGGLLRTITANGVDTDTTITYSGDALSVSAGDWFVILPPGTNFRLVGTIFNDVSSNIVKFSRKGNRVQWLAALEATGSAGAVLEDIRVCCPLATEARTVLRGYEGNDFKIGHPDSASGGYSHVNGWTPVEAYIYATLDFTPEFCRYYCAFITTINYVLFPLSYAYPPGCGY